MNHNQSNSVLSCSDICKRYAQSKILTDVSLEISRSEIVLLLGANGAGKSTLLRLFAGLSRPDKGAIQFLGEAFASQHYPKIGYVAHDPFLYSTLSVAENLKLFATLLRRPQAWTSAIEQFQLSALSDRTPEELSKGELFRVALARAFMGAPEFLLLDEPSSALDEAASVLLKKKVLEACRNGSSALIATHDLKRLMPIATRIIVLKAGQIVRDSAQESVASETVIEWYIEAQV